MVYFFPLPECINWKFSSTVPLQSIVFNVNFICPRLLQILSSSNVLGWWWRRKRKRKKAHYKLITKVTSNWAPLFRILILYILVLCMLPCIQSKMNWIKTQNPQLIQSCSNQNSSSICIKIDTSINGTEYSKINSCINGQLIYNKDYAMC